MKTFLVNLDRETERLAAADRQLTELGIDYERVSAVYGRDLSNEERRAAVNRFRWWCAIGWPVSSGQIGCAMSHYNIYRRMIAEDISVACIFEDDVVLERQASDVILEVERWVDVSRPQVVLLSDHTGSAGVMAGDGAEVCIMPSKCDQYTEGYIVTKVAAQNLLHENWPMQTPCDHWKRWVRRGAIELYHAYPTVCSQNRTDFVGGTVPKGSPVVADLSILCFLLHKVKRAVGLALDHFCEIVKPRASAKECA